MSLAHEINVCGSVNSTRIFFSISNAQLFFPKIKIAYVCSWITICRLSVEFEDPAKTFPNHRVVSNTSFKGRPLKHLFSIDLYKRWHVLRNGLYVCMYVWLLSDIVIAGKSFARRSIFRVGHVERSVLHSSIGGRVTATKSALANESEHRHDRPIATREPIVPGSDSNASELNRLVCRWEHHSDFMLDIFFCCSIELAKSSGTVAIDAPIRLLSRFSRTARDQLCSRICPDAEDCSMFFQALEVRLHGQTVRYEKEDYWKLLIVYSLRRFFVSRDRRNNLLLLLTFKSIHVLMTLTNDTESLKT